MTIASTNFIFSDLKCIGFKYLFTRNLNQDSIDNFFGAIRQQDGNSFNPTLMQFTRAFKKLMGMRIFSHSTNHNCEDGGYRSLDLFTQWKKKKSDKTNIFTSKTIKPENFNVLPVCTFFSKKKNKILQ